MKAGRRPKLIQRRRARRPWSSSRLPIKWHWDAMEKLRKQMVESLNWQALVKDFMTKYKSHLAAEELKEFIKQHITKAAQ